MAICSDNDYIVSGSFDKSIKIVGILEKKALFDFKDAHQGKFKSINREISNHYLNDSTPKLRRLYIFIGDRLR